ncbi:MAG: hypothetical protein K2K93_00930 [Muribaculaceae bacterium]|nr:hypothetical protein [Muribaculaceae bacterium]
MTKHLLTVAVAAAAMAFSASAERVALPLGEDSSLGSGWDSSYEAATKTITFDGAWTGRGWWLGDVDYTGYDEVTVETEATPFAIKLVIEYANDATTSEKMGAKGDTSISLAFNPDGVAHVKQIYIQSTEAGQIVLKDAYISNAAVFDPTVNVTLFEGSSPITAWSWDADKSYSIPMDKLTDNKVAEGNALACTFTATAEGGSTQYTLIHSDWTNEPFGLAATLEGYSAEWNSIAVAGTQTQTMILDAAAIEAIYDPANMKIIITGNDVTLDKIEIIRNPGEGGVSSISTGDTAVEYYNIQGLRVAEPQPGQLVIRRQGGEAVKMIAK